MDISKHSIREWSIVEVVRQLFSSSSIILLPGTTVYATWPGFTLDIYMFPTLQGYFPKWKLYKGIFPKETSQMYFPKWQLPKAFFQATTSQVYFPRWQLPKCVFPSNNFPSVFSQATTSQRYFPKQHFPKGIFPSGNLIPKCAISQVCPRRSARYPN